MYRYEDATMCLTTTRFCDKHRLDHGETTAFCPRRLRGTSCENTEYKEKVTSVGCCIQTGKESETTKPRRKKKVSDNTNLSRTKSRSTTSSGSSTTSSSSTRSVPKTKFDNLPKTTKILMKTMGLVR